MGGSDGYDLNQAITLKTELNVIETYRPSVPEGFRNADFPVPREYRPRPPGTRDRPGKVLDGHRPRYDEFLDRAQDDRLIDVIRRSTCSSSTRRSLREIAKEHNLQEGRPEDHRPGPGLRCGKAGRIRRLYDEQG